MSRSRNWCVTLNNFNDEEYNNVKLFAENSCKYAIIASEKGSKEKTPHLQCYFECKNNISLKALKGSTCIRIHGEIRRGTAKQASDYCKKEGQFTEFGTLRKQGERTDLSKLVDNIHEGKNMREIFFECKNLQQVKVAEYGFKLFEPPRSWKPEVIWYWGEPGSGKSKKAFEENPNSYVWCKSSKWAEGYDAHETVIIDDFRSEFCSFTELLRILDRYEYRVECKGGSRQFKPKKIIITSPYPPEEIYNSNENIKQLTRRIDKIEQMFLNGSQG